MQQARNLLLPESLDELVEPKRAALLVYDMQVGIVPYVHNGDAVVTHTAGLIHAARKASVPIFYSRHFSLPLGFAGVAQLRSALRFQRTNRVDQLRAHLLPGSKEYQLVPGIEPGPDDMVFDKLGMSFFVGTPLEFCLRDLGLVSIVVTGCVAEIGVLPTVLHAVDLGFIPVVASDACGALSEASHQQTMKQFGAIATVATAEQIRRTWSDCS